jgi:hypothetical protein
MKDIRLVAESLFQGFRQGGIRLDQKRSRNWMSGLQSGMEFPTVRAEIRDNCRPR